MISIIITDQYRGAIPAALQARKLPQDSILKAIIFSKYPL